MRTIWLQARLHTAPQFCGLEIKLTDSLTVGIVAFEKAGAHRVTLRADPIRAPHGRLAASARVASGREQRSPLRAVASEPNGRHRNGLGSRLHEISDRKIMAPWLKIIEMRGRNFHTYTIER
ncbi:MAG: hypothetical protein WCB44_08855, partial [Stellaceae bacterium]